MIRAASSWPNVRTRPGVLRGRARPARPGSRARRRAPRTAAGGSRAASPCRRRRCRWLPRSRANRARRAGRRPVRRRPRGRAAPCRAGKIEDGSPRPRGRASRLCIALIMTVSSPRRPRRWRRCRRRRPRSRRPATWPPPSETASSSASIRIRVSVGPCGCPQTSEHPVRFILRQSYSSDLREDDVVDRERVVVLDDGHVVHRQAGTIEQLLHRQGRRFRHQRGAGPDLGLGDEPDVDLRVAATARRPSPSAAHEERRHAVRGVRLGPGGDAGVELAHRRAGRRAVTCRTPRSSSIRPDRAGPAGSGRRAGTSTRSRKPERLRLEVLLVAEEGDLVHLAAVDPVLARGQAGGGDHRLAGGRIEAEVVPDVGERESSAGRRGARGRRRPASRWCGRR